MSATEPAFGEADLTDCDREPIRIPGSVQPHGVLLALDPQTLRVVQAGGAVDRLLGVAPARVAGRRIGRLLGDDAAERLRALLAEPAALPRPVLAFRTEARRSGVPLDCAVHLSDGVPVVEIEPRVGDGVPDALTLVRRMIAEVQGAPDVAGFLRAIAERVRAATGFDRVMVYRFAEDASGGVVAEALAEGMEPYLGLHYPASDIPVQAREMYLTNWMRLIPDARYVPAPIAPPLHPATGRPLDLSQAALRSVSPLHLEYMANMGVAASMSLSLVLDGRLWGLVACHHRSPRHLPHELRAACELFAQTASLQLAEKLGREEQEARLRAGAVHAALVEAMAREDRLEAALLQGRPTLLDLVPAEGAALWVDSRAVRIGRAPDDAAIARLADRLNASAGEGVFETDRLAGAFPEFAGLEDAACGLVALSVSRVPRDYAFWFRPETVRTVTWAGDPAKAVTVDGDGGRGLHPRSSFAAWKETVRGRSRPWEPWAIDAARALRTSILEVVLRRVDLVMRERERARERQDLLLAELDHRVKNTLATIQSLAAHSAEGAGSLEGFVAGFRERLQAMASAHTLLTETRWEGAELETLVLRGTAPWADRVGVSGPRVALRPKAAVSLGLAVHELAVNAARHGALSAPGGRVALVWRVHEADGEGWLELRWSESGGPPVTPPLRSGFGRALLERMLGYDLDGAGELRFEPAGLVAEARVPLAEVVRLDLPEEGRRREAPASAAPPPGALAGRRILVVEDMALVALEVQSILERADAAVLGPAGRLDKAIALAEQEEPDAVLLDIDLHGQRSWPVADVLARRGVPFAFTTGFLAAMVIPDRFAGVPVLSKPYREADLLRVAGELVARRRPR
jgi:light-regulated signal transduction histidine kinase (bacteriophytochrome)